MNCSIPPRIKDFMTEVATQDWQYSDGSPMRGDAQAMLAASERYPERLAELEDEVQRFRTHALQEKAARQALERNEVILHQQLANALLDAETAWIRQKNSQSMANAAAQELACLRHNIDRL